MPVTLPLDQMTLHEKLTVMKLTWDDLVWRFNKTYSVGLVSCYAEAWLENPYDRN
jgi:hypothetical protein